MQRWASLVTLFKKFMLLLLLCGQHGFAVENIAHRGFSGRFQENSLEAIREAWLAGATVVEVDVQLTSDQRLVLFHDKEVARKKVEGLSLKELELFSSTSLPTLPEVLQSMPPVGILLIDLKATSENFVDALRARIQAGGLAPERIYFQSRSFDMLVAIGQNFPKSKRIWVTSLKREGLFKRIPRAEDLATKVKAAGLHGISAKGHQFVDQPFVQAFQQKELLYFVWTINDVERLVYYTQLGVDGVITDRPDLLHPILR